MVIILLVHWFFWCVFIIQERMVNLDFNIKVMLCLKRNKKIYTAYSCITFMPVLLNHRKSCVLNSYYFLNSLMCLVLILSKLFHCFNKNRGKFTKGFCFSCHQKLSHSKILNYTSVTVEEERDWNQAILLMACIPAKFYEECYAQWFSQKPLANNFITVIRIKILCYLLHCVPDNTYVQISSA